MEEKKNREWVKNAAIIFLAVLLVLTFFSNTIMNRSLPEVATQSVISGSIVARVRGTGTVTAVGTNQVKMEQTRQIRSVLVKAGQKVEAGDVLFTLGAGSSEEIEAAEERLQNLQSSYNRTAAGIPSYGHSAEYVRVNALKKAMKEAEAAMEIAKKAAEAASDISTEIANARAELAAAEAKLKVEKANYERELEKAKDSVSVQELIAKQEALIQRLKLDVDILDNEYLNNREKIVEQINRVKQEIVDLEAANTETDPTDPDPVTPPTDPDPVTTPTDPDPVTLPADPDPVTPPTDPDPVTPSTDPDPVTPSTDQDNTNAVLPGQNVAEDPSIVATPSIEGTDPTTELPVLAADILANDPEEDSNNSTEYSVKSPTTGQYDSQIQDKKDRLRELEKGLEEYDDLERQILAAQDTLTPARIAYEEAVAEVEKWKTLLETYEKILENGGSAESENYRKAREAYEAAKEAYLVAYYNLQDELASDQRSMAVSYAELTSISQQIETAKKKLADLLGGEDNQICANVAGIVLSVDCNAGETKQKGDILANIEVPDMGYTLSFSVTNDQANRLRPGDTATVSNFYWGNEIVATLSTIKVDPKNPQTNRVLTFDLEGNVTAGQELTISVGQKSANYDLVVPSSAIRNDSNGSFVLRVEAKNSPLGNRYVVKRVPVEVLASDDSNSAVTAGLNNGDYVATTSNAPIKSGDQVRLAND